MTRKRMSRAGATLACLAVLSVGSPIAGARVVTGDLKESDHVGALAFDQVNTCKSVDLAITKSKGGNEFDSPSTVGPVAGLTFTAKKVAGYDLSQAEAWRKIKNLKAEDVSKANGPFEGQTYTAITDANGTATFMHYSLFRLPTI